MTYEVFIVIISLSPREARSLALLVLHVKRRITIHLAVSFSQMGAVY